MHVFKPGWVTHGNEPIFSIDIHPDNTRFATSGQDSKIKIWNINPLRAVEKESEASSNEKLLCTIGNHFSSVNCVRWSRGGGYLASGSDDKTVLVFRLAKDAIGFGSSTFGSEGAVVNVENWRCVHTLRDHGGDVTHVSWSHDDKYLASCSIDNSIIVWHVSQKFVKVATLRGHQGFVQGMSWDPVGTYLASQSDDKSVIVWRTKDWKIESKITEPFEETSGTVFFRRLDWSPDGQFIVTAHSKNEIAPVASVILRDDWTKRCDFVGHYGPVVAVKSNPHLFSNSKKGERDSKDTVFACCAVGSQDCSLSVWITSKVRPLVVLKDVFSRTVLDLSWGQTGFEFIACSYDGTVCYVKLSRREIGYALDASEKDRHLRKKYGKLALAGGGLSLLENPEQLLFEKKSQAASKPSSKAPVVDLTATVHTPSIRKSNTSQKTPIRSLANNSDVQTSPAQHETITKDGRRRIAPQFIGGTSPLVTNHSSSSKALNSTVIPSPDWGKKESLLANRLGGASSSSFDVEPLGPPPACPPIRSKSAGDMLKGKPFSPQKSKLSAGGEGQTNRMKPIRSFSSVSKADSEQGGIDVASARVGTTIALDQPEAERYLSKHVMLGAQEGTLAVEVDNQYNNITRKISVSKSGECKWETIIPGNSWVNIVSCSKKYLSLSCTNGDIYIVNIESGVREFPVFCLGRSLAFLDSTDKYLMAITVDGFLNLWDIEQKCSVISMESLAHMLFQYDNNKCTGTTSLVHAIVTASGQPVLSLSNGKTLSFDISFKIWCLVGDRASDMAPAVSIPTPAPVFGPLASLQSSTSHYRGSTLSLNTQMMINQDPLVQPLASISYIEQQLAVCKLLKSEEEYIYWMHSYGRALGLQQSIHKLRCVFDDLLGPIHLSESDAEKLPCAKWEPKVLGLSKRKILKDLLDLLSTERNLQRIVSEYKISLAEIANS
eukprot:Nk52_evm28s2192 gene=Nk52_evmTU28s2192